MNDNRRRILELLEQGAVTQEEAERLLTALGEEEPGAFAQAEKHLPSLTLSPGNPEIHVDVDMTDIPDAPEEPDVTDDPQGAHSDMEWRWEAEGIESMDVDWVSGSVQVRPWNGAGVRVTEKARRPLSEEERMAVTVEDGEMRVRWCRRRAFQAFGWVRANYGKQLLIEVPEDSGLENLWVKTASAGVRVSGLQAKELKVKTGAGEIRANAVVGETAELSSGSGSISARDLRPTDRLSLSTASGELEGEALCSGDIRLNTVSGDMLVRSFAAKEVEIGTVSGDARLEGSAESVQCSAVSGDLELQMAALPRQIRADSVSGDIGLSLPKGAGEHGGFSVQYSTSSGDFSSDFPLNGSLGQRKGQAGCGDGDCHIVLSTVSGDMDLKQA